MLRERPRCSCSIITTLIMHIPLQCPKPPYLPQPLCSMDVRSHCVVYVERPLYLKHCRKFWNSRATRFLCSNFLSFSERKKDSAKKTLSFFVQWHLLLSSSLYFLFFFPNLVSLSFSFYTPANLYASCAFTPHFPMLALGILTVEKSVCLGVERVC